MTEIMKLAVRLDCFRLLTENFKRLIFVTQCVRTLVGENQKKPRRCPRCEDNIKINLK
jgi:hypothetical protein